MVPRRPRWVRVMAFGALLAASGQAQATPRAKAPTTESPPKANDPKALYRAGRASEAAGRPLEALRAFEKYLHEGGPNLGEAEQVEVVRRIQLLTTQLSSVKITTRPGAMIVLDGEPLGQAPLAAPVYLEPGTHTLSAGGAEKVLDVAVEERLNVELEAPAPPPEAPSAKSTTPAPVLPRPAESRSMPSLVRTGGFVVSGLLAAGSVYFTTQAVGRADDFTTRQGTPGASRSELEDLQGETRLSAGIALGLGVAAVGALGLTLFVLRGPAERRAAIVPAHGGWAVRF